VTEPKAARGVSAVVFQESVVDRPLTGRRNLTIHARLWGLDGRTTDQRITRLVTAFGLTDCVDRPVETYSGGQRRRLEIARALISEPQVLFLDEPTVGLDPRIRHQLLDLIAGLRARTDTTILLTTHYLDEAEELCDRVAIIHEGRIVAMDSPAALLATLGAEIVELRINGDADTALDALRTGGIAGRDAFVVGATVHVPLQGRPAHQAIAAIADLDVATTAIVTRIPTLDDIYLQLTGASLAAG
jgi:ABC-2 type transport system ATP-binding protein